MFVAESSCIRCRPRLLLANPLARSAGITALEGLDPMVFKSLWDLLPATALTWTFSVSVFDLIQDHPVHIP